MGVWKSSHPAIRFALINLFLSHNNENARGGVIKAFLIVSTSMDLMMTVCLAGRQAVMFWCNANRTELRACAYGGEPASPLAEIEI